MEYVIELLRRELVYLTYYAEIQLRQIAPYWAMGMVIGSFVSVFAGDTIHRCFDRIRDKKWGLWGVVPASMLGIASPLCMYGTIPIAASFSKHGMRHDWLAAFMMSSVLLNPQLLMYSTALGTTAVLVRLISCTVCGIVAGLAVHFYCGTEPFFDFTGFEPRKSRDTDPNPLMRFLKNLGRNLRATGGYFLLGILLSAAFQRYVPEEGFVSLFGQNEGFGVLMAAKRNMLIDRSVNILAMVFAAIPSFAMALGMIYIFAVKLEWFPPYGAKTWKHYILPMATLILPASVGRMRLARTTMLEAIRQEYITMARSKGIPENRVIFVHALKNSMIPLITSILTSFSGMLGGTIILENIFGFPGLGAYIINGINTKDAPTVLASTTFLAAVFCLTSLVLDIIYALVDPRVRERYKTVGK